MEYKIDKSQWPNGPWKDEPDREEFIYRDIKCIINRSHLGNLNGYATFPSDIEFAVNDVNVHGGITFDEIIDGKRIIGFDCAHFYDLVPGLSFTPKAKWEHHLLNKLEAVNSYKDMEFVRNEIKSMVDQVLDGPSECECSCDMCCVCEEVV